MRTSESVHSRLPEILMRYVCSHPPVGPGRSDPPFRGSRETGGLLDPAGILLAAVIAFVMLGAGAARADGALAIGLPSDVAKQGFASGYSYNAGNVDAARKTALDYCRRAPTNQRARSLCSIVETFNHKCVAVAMDPKAGTPGVGWSVAESKSTAESEALARCAATAGDGRRDACKVSDSSCDGLEP
jgi:hypothetical protein